MIDGLVGIMSEDLDETSKEILSVISKNSEISYSKLAEELDVSRNTVYRRVKDLKKRGIIEKDYLKNTKVNVLEFENIGISTLVLALKFDVDDLQKAEDFLSDRDEVKMVLRTYGEYDYFILLFSEMGRNREVISDFRQDLKDANLQPEKHTAYPSSMKKLDLTYSH